MPTPNVAPLLIAALRPESRHYLPEVGEGGQRFLPGIAVRIVPRRPRRKVASLGHDPFQQSRRAGYAQRGADPWQGQQAPKLIPHALRRTVVKPVADRVYGKPRRRFNPERELCGKTQGAQGAQRVVVQGVRAALAQHFSARVRLTAQRIDDLRAVRA